MSESATVRSVTVRLNAEIAKYVTDVRTAGRETDKAFSGVNTRLATTDQKLEDVSKGFDRVESSERRVSTQTRRVGSDIDRLGTKVDSTRVKVDTGSKSIDRFSGRLGLIVSGLTAVGPAAVPIAAVAVPAVTALGSGIGFAAAGAGTFVLAMHGVQDALTKVNKAALEPTEANLLAAHLAMAQLPPDARAFVRELQHLRPELSRLQAAAGSGLFPGLTSGLHSILSDGPLVERALHNIGGELGDLAADAGRSLSSDRWRPFLRFVGTEAPHELGVLGHATGDVAHGLVELWMAFTPLNRDVDAGIRNLARDFDRWATSLGKTKDFQSFVQYIETNGPHVVDLLGDVGQLFVDIVKAAAPLGGPTVQALDLLVKLLDAIANSPLGTPLLLLAQINAILKLTSRGLVGLGVDAKVGLGGVSTGARGGSVALKELRADAVSAGRALKTMGGNVSRNAAPFGSPLTAGVDKEGLNSLAKGAALAGGMTLAVSGLDNQMGLANTTSLALAGSLAGPVGAGIGGAVGLTLDWQAALEKDRKSMEDFNTEVNKLASQGQLAQLRKLSTQLHGFQDQAGDGIVADTVGKLLADVDPALARTKTKVDGLTGAQRLAAAAAGKYGHAEQVAARQTLAMRQAAAQTAGAFRTLGGDLDNSKVSLDKWIHQLAAQAQALEHFGTNAKRAADKGLRDGLIKQLEAAGPAGALRMAQLADATQSQIARANHAWGSGKKAANDYQAAVAYIANHPANVSVKGVPESLHEIRMVESALRNIHDKVVHITTERSTGGRSLAGADGGTIPGQRAPYGDKVLIHAAPGEEIITNRHGEADQFRADRAMGRIPAYAGGGTVDTHVTSSPAGVFMTDPGLGAAADGVRSRLHRLQDALDTSTKTLDRERAARQRIVQARSSLVSTVRDQFRTDIFGDQSVWGAGSDPLGIVQGDTRDARQFGHLISQLKHRGASRGLLSQITSLTDAQQIAGLSRGQLDRLDQALAVRRHVTGRVSAAAGDAAFGEAIATQTRVAEHQLGEVRHLRREVAALRKELAHHPAQTGQAVGKTLDHGAKQAARKVPR